MNSRALYHFPDVCDASQVAIERVTWSKMNDSLLNVPSCSKDTLRSMQEGGYNLQILPLAPYDSQDRCLQIVT